ncbi:MAG: extracellular solute-binding protein [Aggregatilineales bacterium]
MTKRWMAALVSLSLMAALLATESLAWAQGMADSIRVSVVAGAMQATMNKIVGKYVAENPGVNITLELEPEGGVFQALIAAGNQPDLVITSFGPQLGTLAAQNALVPIDTLEGGKELLERVVPRALQKLYGRNYYVPVGADVTLMIYNRALFEEAGLDPENPPRTWAEFLRAIEAIHALPPRPDGSKVYGTVFWNDALQWGGWYWNMLQPIYLNANQGKCQLMNALGTDVIIDRPECKLDKFFEFVKAAQQFAPPTGEPSFFSRNVGSWLQYGYSWQPNLRNANQAPMVIGEDVLVAPVPVPEEGDQSFSTFGGRAAIILRTTPEREARAWHFLQFLMRDENNYQFITELGYLPVLKSLQDDPFFQTPDKKVFVELLQNSLVPEQFANADRAAVAFQAIYQEVVVKSSIPLEEAVKAAAEAARRAVRSGR